MSLEAAARLTETLLALALLQQGFEHLRGFARSACCSWRGPGYARW